MNTTTTVAQFKRQFLVFYNLDLIVGVLVIIHVNGTVQG